MTPISVKNIDSYDHVQFKIKISNSCHEVGVRIYID